MNLFNPLAETIALPIETSSKMLKIVDRRFTPIEGYIFRRIDIETGVQRSLKAYARVFSWDDKTVKKFFDDYKLTGA